MDAQIQKQVMTLTAAAAAQVRDLMDARDEPAFGLRIGVRSGGCSGMAYTLEFVAEKEPLDEVIEDHGVTVLVDPKATLFLIGTEMDYVDAKLQSGFVFNNPNEKGRCGCGESFHV